ncbi:3'-5' exonuclease-like [Coffea arabica]|uniref:3'-5' exonuclease-like n=1 Tax=Coffea arabica TaxID=13443 RepID=A0A6P6T0I2_COFAR|nr:Werner Syndrome-like exonuclease [Coffea arabica]
MEIGIEDHDIPDDSHDFYDIYFYSDRINTMVTHDPSQVSRWLSHTQRIHRHRLNNLIVGLDVEWRPSFSKYHRNPVATLQLCVGRRCLVFQILRCSREYNEDEFIPEDLRDFLAKEDYTFVGVGIQNDVQNLEGDYGLEVSGRIVDLRRLAAGEYDRKELRNTGMKELARLVLGREVQKPRWVTMGRWDSRWLNPDQVQYACVDAFVSFEIGRRLDADEYED